MPFFVIAEGMPLPAIQELGLASLFDALGSRSRYRSEHRASSVFGGPFSLRAEADDVASSWAQSAAPWFAEQRICVLKAPNLELACRKLALAKALAQTEPERRWAALHLHRRRSPYHKHEPPPRRQNLTESRWRVVVHQSPALETLNPAFADVRRLSDEYLQAVRAFVRTHDMADPANAREVQERWIAPLDARVADLASAQVDLLEPRLFAKRSADERRVTDEHRAALQHARRNLDGIRLLCERSPAGSEAEQWPWADTAQVEFPPSI